MYSAVCKPPMTLWSPRTLIFNGCQWYLPARQSDTDEADHTLPAITEGKNAWIYTFTPPDPLMVRARENLPLLFSEDVRFEYQLGHRVS
jgi:hypothetical protein